MPKGLVWFGLLCVVVAPRVLAVALLVGLAVGSGVGLALPWVDGALACERPVVVDRKPWRRVLQARGDDAPHWPTSPEEADDVDEAYVLWLRRPDGVLHRCPVRPRRAWEVWEVGASATVRVGPLLGAVDCATLAPGPVSPPDAPPTRSAVVAGS